MYYIDSYNLTKFYSIQKPKTIKFWVFLFNNQTLTLTINY